MTEKRPASNALPAFTDPAEMVNAVISALQVPEEPTHVAGTYANAHTVAAEVQAYAKIAGRDWTYYVKTLAVAIGRNTEPSANTNTNENPAPGTGASAQQVQIDLGPAKVVSRQHAAIAYNIDLRCWELVVLGRNGARVDGSKVPVGAQHATPLHLGAVLDIGGTQMMFILPDTPPRVAPKMLALCLARYSLESAHKRARSDPHGQHPSAPSHARLVLVLGMSLGEPGLGLASASAPGTALALGLAVPPGFQSMSSFQMFEQGLLAHSPSLVLAVSLQNNLDQDLLREDAKDIKPPYSYATMITQAILSNPDGVMSLAEIYAWISLRYAYYKYSKTGWQNSIRHNLSLNKAFEKVPRRPNEPGKGMKWQISDAYRSDFLQKVNTGTLLKSRRGSSVSRTLQMHLATHQGLPETKLYPKPDAHGPPVLNHAQYPPPQQQQSQQNQQHHHQQQNGYTVPYGAQNYPQRPMVYNQPGAVAPPPPHQQQQQQQLPPPVSDKRMELASPLRHPSADSVKHENYGAPAHQQSQLQLQPQSQPHQQPQSQPQNGATAPSAAPQYAPGINLFKATPVQPKQEGSDNGVARASFANTSSHVPNTSESMAQNTTAPTTSNTSELGLSFTSPKKIAPLEAFTPERGSKSAGIGGKSGGNASVNQSSPAFWNFVQFSTPNGQTPGRKNSDESNGQESPTLNRGPTEKGTSNIYDDSPPK